MAGLRKGEVWRADDGPETVAMVGACRGDGDSHTVGAVAMGDKWVRGELEEI